MSLINLAHVCSHIRNCLRVRLKLTSIPMTKLHLTLMLRLQQYGLISTVDVGGIQPPSHLTGLSDGGTAIRTPIGVGTGQYPRNHPIHGAQTDEADALSHCPWLSFPDHELGPESELEQKQKQEKVQNDTSAQLEYVIPANPAHRRIWIGLKYYHNQPVLRQLQLCSKASRRISLRLDQIIAVEGGENRGLVKGLRTPGDLLFLNTNRGLLEARECIDQRVGGMALCRVW